MDYLQIFSIIILFSVFSIGNGGLVCYKCTVGTTGKDRPCVQHPDKLKDNVIGCPDGRSCFCYTYMMITYDEKENSVTRGIRMDDTSYKETEGCSYYGRQNKAAACYKTCRTKFCNSNNINPYNDQGGGDENTDMGHEVILHGLPEWQDDWNYDKYGVKCTRWQCSHAPPTLGSSLFTLLFIVSLVVWLPL